MDRLEWTVLPDSTLTAPLLERLHGLWDRDAPLTTARRSLLDGLGSRVAVLVADQASGGRTVGIALAGHSPDERFGVVDYVFVAPDRRQENLGHLLVDRAVDELRPHIDVLFADAAHTSEEFLRSMGWRLAPRGGAYGWVPQSGRLRIFPPSPMDSIDRLAVRVLETGRVGTTVMLAPASGATSWAKPVLDAMMRGDLAQRDLDEPVSRAVDKLLATR